MMTKRTWTSGIGYVIAQRRLADEARELRRMRYVVATFLRKCTEVPVGLRETAADIEIGEYSVLEYLEDLLRQAHEHERVGFWPGCSGGVTADIGEFEFMHALSIAHL